MVDAEFEEAVDVEDDIGGVSFRLRALISGDSAKVCVDRIIR